MATFVLIHGSWHGGWCWERIVPRLEAAGHRAMAPDLASLGADQTPPGEVTLATWTDAIGRIVDAEPEPVVLVGHSRGGIVVSQVAEERPERVTCLVYLAAALPQDGESLMDLAQTDTESLILPNLAVNEAGGFHTINLERAPDIFYNASPREDAARAVPRLRPEPNAPTFTPVRLTEGKFGRVPRVYVRCLRDHAIGPALQERMYTAQPCRNVITLDTDHSPFYSAKQDLTTILTSLPEAGASHSAPAAGGLTTS